MVSVTVIKKKPADRRFSWNTVEAVITAMQHVKKGIK